MILTVELTNGKQDHLTIIESVLLGVNQQDEDRMLRVIILND